VSFANEPQGLRRARGLSQTELAKRAGISIDSLRNWEQGRVLPRIDAAHRLARALGVSLDGLVDSDDDAGAVRSAKRKKAEK